MTGLSTCSCMKWVGKFKKNPSTKVFKKTGEIMLAVKPISQFTWSRHWVVTLSNCAVVSLDRRGVIKTWTEVAARVRLYMLMSNLTSLVPLQFSHWLQVGKVGTDIYIFSCVFLEFRLTPRPGPWGSIKYLDIPTGESLEILRGGGV